MALLALDASTEACAVGIKTQQGDIFEAFEIAPRRHTELLPKMLDSVLLESKIKKQEIQGCVIGVGPGAFTGIRIGVATVQGIALGLNIPCYAVSSLHALAQQALLLKPELRGSILACIDARMDEVYFAEYEISNTNTTTLVNAEQLMANDAFVMPDSCKTIAGSGSECVKNQLGTTDFVISECYPTASSLLQIEDQHELISVAAEALTPSYIRNNVTHK